ncbi:MAG TPA: sigma-54-dependent Fis family transcriptional regulator [Caldithrix abyssi]|uniref:Sigma-54-dependent Fis family transcriptional regulator n=1 Tax=Caldithrix abyssi TaxID=187145 RepID=A0A7V5H4V8_CALAY|nr:sigma-54-dependent Fis family transcriptional regulator [Caldisericaceae bacterium]HHE55830.1 sigma-54-dependent Fis family transcriptional regulator [Caldithrix abyssi]
MEDHNIQEVLKEKLGFYGVSQPVEEILQTIQMVAPTDLSVLIQGESGTGKEVVANALHNLSKRKHKPLVSVNCGAIPEGILESELFGHEKGSFTGAIAQRKGYFEAANGGTIFLDEIGEMPLNTQVKLLRVLETSEIMRVGGTTPIKVDVRVIAATNKDLEKAVENNEFRRDLYFRLKAITIFIPPLRKRKEDIPVLVKKFADEFVQKNQIYFKGFAPEAIELLKQYDWPGNVRELKNFVETAITLNRGEIIHSSYVRSVLNLDNRYTPTENLPVPLNKTPEQAERELIYRTLISLKLDITELKQMLGQFIQTQMEWMKNQMPVAREQNDSEQMNSQEIKPTSISAMERELIKETLKRFNGNRRKTAKALQISERTLYRKLHEYGLS